MNSKLTLKLDEEAIAGAKAFAKSKGLSLSGIVERYFFSLAAKSTKDYYTVSAPTLVDELTGIVKVPKNYDHKKAYTEYLRKKYS